MTGRPAPWTTSRASWPPPSPPDAHLRVSDAERRQVTDELCRHAAEGRLDETEFAERVEATHAAKTRAELAAVLVDLPPPAPSPPAGPQARPAGARHPLVAVLVALVVAEIVLGATTHAAGAAVAAAAGVAHLLLVVLAVGWILRRRHRRLQCAGAGRS